MADPGEAETAAKEEEKKKKEAKEPLNLSIHVMPKRFMEAASQAKTSKNAGLSILFGGVFLFLALGGGAYYYFFVRMPAAYIPPEISQTESNSTSTADDLLGQKEEEAAQIADAKKSYLDFKNSLANLSSLEDYSQLVLSQSEGAFLSDWNELQGKVDELNSEGKSQFLDLVKNCQPNIAEIENIINGSRDTSGKVVLTATSSSFSLQADMFKVNGSWKIISEEGLTYLDEKNTATTLAQWVETRATSTLPAAESALTPAKDSDSDGLTDTEEALLGTKPDAGDSDSDNYTDLDELKNLYNPAGAGKITENEGIKAYVNASFNYSLLYPGAWNTEKVTGGDSVIFRSPDNQFLQILVQPNANKESIAAWYQSQFESAASAPDAINKTDKDGKPVWQGIKSPDGLTLYLTGSIGEYIYVLSYSPGESKSLEYPNIYQLMIDSLQLGK